MPISAWIVGALIIFVAYLRFSERGITGTTTTSGSGAGGTTNTGTGAGTGTTGAGTGGTTANNATPSPLDATMKNQGATWKCTKQGFGPAYEMPNVNPGVHESLAQQGWTCTQL